ncbi:MAG: 4'-phosphopantetheinyl transferase superfamily protein [Clostridia bacterium]
MQIYYNLFDETEDEKIKGQLLLNKVLNIKGYNVENIKIQRTTHGRPYSNDLDFDFNISHTKGMACVVTGGKVGVDCQKIVPVKNSVAKRVCSDKELETLLNSSNYNEEFIRLWCFKEAFTKMVGSGFKYGFKNATVENAFCLCENIKIFQKRIDDIIITAVQEQGNEIKITEIQ